MADTGREEGGAAGGGAPGGGAAQPNQFDPQALLCKYLKRKYRRVVKDFDQQGGWWQVNMK